MPFFYRASRIPKIDDTIFIDDSTLYRNNTCKQADPTDIVRPHTSSGSSRRHPQNEGSSLAHVKRRLSIVMSRSTTTLPIPTTTLPARHILRASQSNTVLPIDTTMSLSRSNDVGLAIGSPSELQQQDRTVPLIDTRPNTPENLDKQIRAGTDPQSAANRPQLKRWKTVSGLFTRRKTVTPIPTSLVGAFGSPSHSSTKQAGRDSVSRANSYFHRKSRESTPTQTPNLQFDSRSTILTPTPGDARAVEAGDDIYMPNLEIDIPTGSLDRYSVMFSNVFSTNILHDPAQGSAATMPASEPRNLDLERRKLEDRLHISTELLYPLRTQPLLPCGSIIRDSAVPAALFSSARPRPSPYESGESAPKKMTWFSRGSLHNLDAVRERDNLPEDIEAWALGVSSHDLVQPRHSHRESIDSFNTSAGPSPALTSSTWCSKSIVGERRHSLALPIMRSDDKHRSVDSDHFLSVPSPTNRTSCGSSTWSPSFALSTTSPSMKFGYDEPQSPNICVATSVQVSLRSGQCYKPQFVCRESDHSRQASCSGLLA